MIDQLIGQFLASQDGKSTVAELTAQGLDPQQATSAVTATAEGAASHLGDGGGGNPLGALLGGASSGGGLLGGLLGGGGAAGGGGNPLGALGGLLGGGGAPAGGAAGANPLGALGGLLGGGGAPAAPGAPANPLAGLTAPIATFVAQKTGLAPAMAQTVVAVVLPKVIAWFQSSNGPKQP